MKEVYKVVTVNEKRTRRTSYLAHGHYERTYSTQEWTTPVEGSIGLYAFETEEQARSLFDEDDCEIWLAEATNVRYPPNSNPWIEGTVFCDSLRLLQKLV